LDGRAHSALLAVSIAAGMAGAGCQNHLRQVSFQEALRAKDVARVRAMVEKDPSLVHATFTGRHSGVASTALTLAVQTGDLELVRFFIERGAPVNLATLTKDSALHKAVVNKNLEMTKLLLSRGANVQARGDVGRTPIFNADGSEQAELLVAAGALADAYDDEGDTPLHFKAEYGHVEDLAFLCAHGGTVTSTNKAGRTPHQSALRHFEEMKGQGVPADILAEQQAVADYLAPGGPCARLAALRAKEGRVPKDAWTLELHRAECDHGLSRGCAHLAEQYEEGRGVAVDPVAALGLYEKSCAGGHAWGCARLGVMLTKGRGVARDEARAASLFDQGCRGKVQWACARLAALAAARR
jgi:hypothetical protein